MTSHYDDRPLRYDDTYTGERHTYGLTYRPLSSSNVPRDWILFSDRPHPDFRHGVVDYPRRLTAGELAGFQLTAVERRVNGIRYRPLTAFPPYLVGDDGSVWSEWDGRLRQLHPWAKANGYHRVTLRRDGRNVYRDVHRLVLEAFVGPAPPGYQAAHGNGNRANNTLANLRWATPAENCADREQHGRTVRGTRVNTAKLTEEAVRSILAARERGETQRSLARQYGVTHRIIRLIEQGVLWSHVQYPRQLTSGEIAAFQLTPLVLDEAAQEDK